MKLLSICIPTYNRKDNVYQTVYDIVAQIKRLDKKFKDTVEVIIYDNASGRYIWPMGDDDMLVPDAINYALNFITDKPVALALLNYLKLSDYKTALRTEKDLYFETGKEFIDYGLKHFSLSEWDAGKLSYYNSLIFHINLWPTHRKELPCEVMPQSYILIDMIDTLPISIVSRPIVIQNNLQKTSAWLPFYWMKMYWFIGKTYDRKLQFSAIIVHAFLANLKYQVMKLWRK